jgi:hypothetical protein
VAVHEMIIEPLDLRFYISGYKWIVDPHSTKTVDGDQACMRVLVQYYDFGKTHLTIGHFDDVRNVRAPDWDRILFTPDRKFFFKDSFEEYEFPTIDVPTEMTRIRIWVDPPTFSDRVVVGWSALDPEKYLSRWRETGDLSFLQRPPED